MTTFRLLTFVALMSATAIPWALGQEMPGVPGTPASISEGSYGGGFQGPGSSGPGSYGPGSFGAGSYNSGVGASRPQSPFSYFSDWRGGRQEVVAGALPPAPPR